MDIVQSIQKLKKEKNAVILVHNYQQASLYDIADYIGDSLGLSAQAAKTSADIIVFCGVYFMAETAKILSPQKIVLIPDDRAGCPMADMITASDVRDLRKQYPKAKILCYVNTSAEVKAECDICCTSANAVSIVKKALQDEKEIIFVPDKYLAFYVSTQTPLKIIPWQGYCPTHVKIIAEDILRLKKIHSQAEVIAHPECNPEVLKLSDQVLSTGGMCSYVKQAKAKEFIVGTEIGMLSRLKRDNPSKEFYAASEVAVCPNMKLITLEKVLQSFLEMKYKIIVPQQTSIKARKSIQKMLEIREMILNK